jgi:hypothetical protein
VNPPISQHPSESGTEARAARDTALADILTRADPDWIEQAEAALLAAIDRLGEACIDDCRDAVPVPTVACWWCVVPRRLAVRRLIHRVGCRPGRAKVTHAGDLRLWARLNGKGEA